MPPMPYMSSSQPAPSSDDVSAVAAGCRGEGRWCDHDHDEHPPWWPPWGGDGPDHDHDADYDWPWDYDVTYEDSMERDDDHDHSMESTEGDSSAESGAMSYMVPIIFLMVTILSLIIVLIVLCRKRPRRRCSPERSHATRHKHRNHTTQPAQPVSPPMYELHARPSVIPPTSAVPTVHATVPSVPPPAYTNNVDLKDDVIHDPPPDYTSRSATMVDMHEGIETGSARPPGYQEAVRIAPY